MTATTTKLPVRDETKSVESVPRTPDWPMFADLRREMDRLFDDFGRGWFRAPMTPDFDTNVFARTAPVPAVDVVEKDGAWVVTAELPGLDEKAIDITIAGDLLTLKGEKTETREEDDKGAHLSERRYGSFARSFRLPDGVDRGKIGATFANGVLTVTLPKLVDAKAEEKKIEVKAA
ncbi:MAG: Hsp20/alpha crystallin family protein [Hyphomicrobiales bacterium]|nr:Hsp20/alpha crystallin family protein [Hyphomicrobiales bacterium]